jgi:hypothetical protein
MSSSTPASRSGAVIVAGGQGGVDERFGHKPRERHGADYRICHLALDTIRAPLRIGTSLYRWRAGSDGMGG